MEQSRPPAPAASEPVPEPQPGTELVPTAHEASRSTAVSSTDEDLHVYPEPWDSSPSVAVEPPREASTGGGGGTPPSGGDGGGGDGGGDSEEEEEEMTKMSFLDHLEELRYRLIRALIAVAAGFFACFWFAEKIFQHMSEPLTQVLVRNKMKPEIYFNKPTDAFTMYLNLALVAGLFLASPMVIYQVWAFISPGLYQRERKYAAPFIFFCSALFIGGGLFGYFIAFPYALEFLITYGGPRVVPLITITEYVDMFWTVILGLGIVFELPVLMFFLGLLGILTPGFLMRNFRYAVLIIFIVAAVVTPTSDITNLMIFALPMCALYLVGVGLVWMVARRRRSSE